MSGNSANLLIIDPQYDFCNPNPRGALYVNGAEKDMARVADMIMKHGDRIATINVTLDSHSSIHIAHPIFWVDSKGAHPNPFTVITLDDVNNGTWRATNPSMQDWAVSYVKALKDDGKFVLSIWVPHCLIGSVGATVDATLFAALCDWESHFRKVNYVPKGSNPFTEHYSVVKACVPYTGDPTTMLNHHLINMLKNGNDIVVCGEATDFCVASSLRDIIEEFSVDEVKKFVLLTDGTSAVNAPGLEHLSKQFIDEMTAKGMRLSTTTDYFA